MRLVMASCLLLLAASATAQQQYVPYLQQKPLMSIAECATASCVDAVLADVPYVDPPLRLIAASRLSQLHAAVAAERLAGALPRDPVAFWFCYSVTVPSLGPRFRKVRDLYDLYFPAAAKAAAESGTHVRDFLSLAAFADGEMAASIAEDVASIQAKNPAAYCAALATLHEQVKRHLPSCAPRQGGTKD
jgi:hypothetical protein